MKRTVIAFALLCSAVLSTNARIPEDFYLRNAPLQSPPGTEIKILPSTLRVVLCAGETEELYADIIPENAPGAELSWRLSGNGGSVRIYPRGRTCVVLGVSEGEDSLSVSCGEEAVNIPVTVRSAPEVKVRSFEYEGERRAGAGAPTEKYRTVVRALITLGALLCAAALFCIIKTRREKENENDGRR